MKIAVDVMGFENPVSEAVNACKKLVKKYSELEIILVGDEQEIRKTKLDEKRIKIVDTKIFISQSDEVFHAIRKKNSSMAIAIDLVLNKEADAVVSAGSTACYVALTYSKLGLIKNISKPAFTPFLPTITGSPIVWSDVGANKTCDERDLICFSKMASIVSKVALDIENPRVSLLNIGTEEYKGLDYIVEANKKLKNESNLNYIGYLESREILFGKSDVLISDGFIGNIALKSLEGTFKAVSYKLKKDFKKPSGWLGALFSFNIMKKLKNTFDYKKHAGAIVLGLNELAIKTHGSADEEQFISTIELAIKCIKNNLIDKLKEVKF